VVIRSRINPCRAQSSMSETTSSLQPATKAATSRSAGQPKCSSQTERRATALRPGWHACRTQERRKGGRGANAQADREIGLRPIPWTRSRDPPSPPRCRAREAFPRAHAARTYHVVTSPFACWERCLPVNKFGEFHQNLTDSVSTEF
jgi:hypothetical protein